MSNEFVSNAGTDGAKIIGAAVPRIDGPLKTTGSARYASDYNFPRMVYAVPVCATIANGKIRSMDTSMAESLPGVLTVLHHGNFGPVFRMPPGRGGRVSEDRAPFEDEVIYYWGQYVALAVAETYEQALAGAAAVRADYDAQTPNASTNLDALLGEPHVESTRGNPDAAFASAPAETHNPMEMHASVAVWDGKKFTLYESTQGVVNHLNVMAQVLGVPRDNIQIISKFIGSGFGGKLFPWPHSALAAMASRKLNRPVKLTLNRKMMFGDGGTAPPLER